MIRDLWRAWKEMKKKRQAAKLALTNTENLLKGLKDRRDKIKRCYNLFIELHNEEELTHVQNLLKTEYYFYKRLYEGYFGGYSVSLAESFWENGDYDDVVRVCSELETKIKEEIEIWINQNQNNK